MPDKLYFLISENGCKPKGGKPLFGLLFFLAFGRTFAREIGENDEM